MSNIQDLYRCHFDIVRVYETSVRQLRCIINDVCEFSNLITNHRCSKTNIIRNEHQNDTSKQIKKKNNSWMREKML